MPCFHPLKAYRGPLDESTGKLTVRFSPTTGYQDRRILLPCGQCVGCRLERSRQWAIRCFHEAQLHDENSFVTLTYNEENLPKDASLSVRHLQLFIKRLRKKYGTGIRYYACGEYGEQTRRPHYHLILFNFRPPDLLPHLLSSSSSSTSKPTLFRSASLDVVWGKGYTLTGHVTFQSAAYVARYIMKKITGATATNHYEQVDETTGEIFQLLPEFTTMSRRPGIGKDWYDKYKSEIYDHDNVVIKGRTMRPPRFYDKQHEKTDPSDYARVKRARVRDARQHADNNTPERLSVRETVTQAKLNRLPRDKN